MSSARVKRSVRRSNSPDTVPGEQPGLRRIVQNRLLTDVFEAAGDKHPGWKVLVVDEHAMRVISSAIGMYDIMERKITIVESLEKKRAPFPDMAAIYVLEPSAKSVQLLLEDFHTKPLYGNAVFLYFLGHLPDSLFNQIKSCSKLLKRLKGLSEINVDFLAKEERAFTFDMRDVFPSLYLRQQAAPAELIIAEKLVTVCGTLNEYPHIRYKNSSAVCQSLASVFKIKMDEFVAQNPSWWYHGGPKKNQAAKSERATLLLLDRGDDCLSPLMHDFTYQAMVHDLLEMDGDRITYENDKGMKQDVLLDEKDSIWVELRGKHIAAVIETLSNRIREIMNSNTGSAFSKKQGEGNLSLSQMASALKALPEYQEVMSKLSQHMHLSHQCMDQFTKQSLIKVAEIEQTLATGQDEEGRSPKIGDVMDQAEDLLTKMKSVQDKLRFILAATIACGGLRQQDKRRLTGAAELTGRELRVLNVLEIFGLSIFNANEKNSKVTGIPGRLSNQESDYSATRYVPALKTTLEALLNEELSFDEYPSVTPMPASATSKAGKGAVSARSGTAASLRKSAGATSRWNKSSAGGSSGERSTGPTSFMGSRTIVFMLGGLCYPELRVAREIMEHEGREIIMGSTAFLSAKDFIEDLGNLAEKHQM